MADEEITVDAALERAGINLDETPAAASAEATEEEQPEGDSPVSTPEGEGAPEGEETPETTEKPTVEPTATPAEPAAQSEEERLAAIVTGVLVKAGYIKAAEPAPAEPAKPPIKVEVKPPAYIARLLASEDPEVKADAEAMFEDWKETRSEIAEIRERFESREDAELAAGLAAELNEVVDQYQGLDPKAVDDSIAAFAEDPKTAALCAALAENGGMAAVVRHLYPDAVKKAKPAATPAGGGPERPAPSTPGRKVPGSPRTQPGVLARGGGSATPARPAKPSAPPKDESMGDAIDRAFRERPELANSATV